VISIAHKTTLRTALLVMAILILTTYTAYRRESRLLRNSLLAQGHYVTQNVADSARNTFWTLNWTYIEKMLTHSMVPSHNPEEPQFFFARIVKGDGEIYLAGNHAENGMKMPDDFLVGEPRVVEDEVDPVTGHAGFLFSTPFVVGAERWYAMTGVSAAPLRSLVRRMLLHNLCLGTGVLFLGVALAFLQARAISRPVRDLAETADRVARGELNKRSTINTNDELALLGSSFNTMLDRINEANTSLNASEETYRTIFALSPEGIMLVSPSGIIVNVNNRISDWLGYAPSEVIGRHMLRMPILAWKDKLRVMRNFSRRLHGDEVPPYEVIFHGKHNREFTGRVVAKLLRNEAGKVVGDLAVISDVTDERAAERNLVKRTDELFRQQQLLATIVNNAPLGIWFMGADQKMQFMNPSFCEAIGIPEEEWLSVDHYSEIMRPCEAKACMVSDRAALATTAPHHSEEHLTLTDGHKHTFEIMKQQVLDDDGRTLGLVGIAVDITEREDAAKKQAAAQETIQKWNRFQAEINGISQHLVGLPWPEIDKGITDALGRIGSFVDAHRAYVFIFRDGSIMDNTHEWCAAGIEPQIENLKGLPLDTFPWWISRLKARSTIYIPRVDDMPAEAAAEKGILKAQDIRSIIVVPLEFGGRVAGFVGFDAVHAERAWAEYVPSLLRVVADICSGILERARADRMLHETNLHLEARVEERTREAVEEGAKASRAATDLRRAVTDLEQTNRELKQAESRLVMQEKLASAGRLAAGVAHELNNPIGFLMNNFAALEDDVELFRSIITDYRGLLSKAKAVPSLKEAVSHLEQKEREIHLDFTVRDIEDLFAESRDGFARTMAIVDSMRDLARSEKVDEKAEYNINDAIRSTLVLARNEYKYHSEVDVEYGDIPPVVCQPSQINQVFLNLVVNAAQAIAGQGRKSKGTIVIRSYATDAAVCCDVSDDGPGVPEDILDKVFEPFFTTKPPGKGTGLGLGISYDIVVNRHGGSLTVDSSMGKGALFKVCLPLHVAEDANSTKVTS
jgi:PAS domain S-box-containing protein